MNGLFDKADTIDISVSDFLLCIGVAILCGLFLALCFQVNARCSKSFFGTLALLPAIVCVVIMMVNGNVGAGVAVAGAFSLVRFHSAPGTAKEIGAIFTAMGAGLICGMGYLFFAGLFTLILAAMMLFYNLVDFGIEKKNAREKVLRVTIPEDLDYTGVFDDIFDTYTSSHRMTQVKTSNMGSLFRLTYRICLSDASREKEMIDAMRCRNGNLEITISGYESGIAEEL